MRKALFLAACALFLLAGIGSADAGTFLVGPNATEMIHMVNGGKNYDVGGGSFDISVLNSDSLMAYAYCVDPYYTIKPGGTYYADVDFGGKIRGTLLTNADQVAWLLTNFGRNAGNDPQKEAALQAAIWSAIAPGAVLNAGKYENDDTLKWYTDYTTALASAVTGGSLGNFVGNFYWISPSSGSGTSFQWHQGTVAFAATPVPGTLLLLGSGLAGLVGIARFRRKRSAG